MKRALVLSGGGAKGAFQLGALQYLRENGYARWDTIAGISVGALNGVMLAMEKFDDLENIWQTISNGKVYKGNLNKWTAIKLALKKIFGLKPKSILSNKPLGEDIKEKVKLQDISIDFRIGTVALGTGDYYRIKVEPATKNVTLEIFKTEEETGTVRNKQIAKLNAEEFKSAVLASTAMPIFWEPVTITTTETQMVDGGVRNVSPLADVLDSDPDEVVIINCSSFEPAILDKPLDDILDIALRTIEIMTNEILRTDIREFLRINEMVEQAEAENVLLYKKDGTRYQSFKYLLIKPDEKLNNTLDFSTQAVQSAIEQGRRQAEKALNKSRNPLRLAA